MGESTRSSGGEREIRVHQVAAEGFDKGADSYERARPSYPDEAVALIVERLGIRPGRRVLDLAAGTGKLTRLLVPTGAELIALEPVEGMRVQLERAVPGVEALDGTAESVPLPDASIDAVVCAQAWHWFDSPRALTEMARVLRPPTGEPSGLAVLFNIRDESVDWVREVTTITEFMDANRPHHRTTRQKFAAEVEASGAFGRAAESGGIGPVELHTFRYSHTMTPDLLVERMASQSNVAIMDDAKRAAVLDEVRELARTHPDLAGRDEFEMPYDTEVALCFRS